MTGIPVSQIVNVIPSVVSPRAQRSFLNPLILTRASVASNPGDTLEVQDLIGLKSVFKEGAIEYQMAETIFAGVKNVARRPKSIFFATLPTDPGKMSEALALISNSVGNWTGVALAFVPDQTTAMLFSSWIASRKLLWGIIWDDSPYALLPDQGADKKKWSIGRFFRAQPPSSNISLVYKDPNAAALALAWMATLDFDATNGRRPLAFTQSDTVTPTVTDATSAQILASYDYSFYGQYGAASGDFAFFYDGRVYGPNKWADAVICQAWLSNEIQSSLIALFLQQAAIPFTSEGDAMIAAACRDTLDKAVNFGVIRQGVTLETAQLQTINRSAGRDISRELYNQGYYLVPGASIATPEQRLARKIPGGVLWYCDGGSVQSIDFSTVEIA